MSERAYAKLMAGVRGEGGLLRWEGSRCPGGTKVKGFLLGWDPGIAIGNCSISLVSYSFIRLWAILSIPKAMQTIAFP